MVDNNLTECIQEFADRLNRLEILISENLAKSNQAADSDQLLTVEQAAEFLHLSVPTLYAKVCKRAIPHEKEQATLLLQAGTQELSERWANIDGNPVQGCR